MMIKKFGVNNSPNIGVYTILPCDGSQCRHILQLPNFKMGKKGGRKRRKSGGATNKYPQQNHHSHHQH